MAFSDFLSAVEIGCIVLCNIDIGYARHGGPGGRGAASTGAEAIAEISARLTDIVVRYQFENGQIIRID